MVIRRPVTLPPYTPSRWELRLPDYPIVLNSWQSSSFPEILGSLPGGAEWRLYFENRTSAETIALILPYRATAGGRWPLTELPGELAGGVNSTDFTKRLTGTTWTMAAEPKADPVESGRFNVTIELVYELTLDSVYGPGSPTPILPTDIPLRLGFSSLLTVVAIPTTTTRIPVRRPSDQVVLLGISAELSVAAVPITTTRKPVRRSAGEVIAISMDSSLAIAAANLSRR
jgi:hypothetical protein